MFNLIKMNFYRLFHQRSFYICVAVAAVIGWFMTYMVWLTPRMEERARELAASGEESFEAGFHVGFINPDAAGDITPAPKLEEFNVTEFADEFVSSSFNMILISVAVPLMVNAERKRGFIKNLGGQIKPRGMLLLSRLPLILFETAVIYVVTLLSFALCGRIYYQQYTLGDLSALCKMLAVQLLLGWALGTLLLLVCTIGRSAAAGIIMGIVVSSGISPLVCSLMNKFAAAYLGASPQFDISGCFLDHHIHAVTSEAEAGALAAALLAGVAYLVLASAAGCLIMEKRDIV